MGTIKQTEKVRLYTGVHDSRCVSKVDLKKKYTLCFKRKKHYSTNSWKAADAKFLKWSKK